MRRFVLERAPERHHLVAGQHRLGEDADLPHGGVTRADDPEHRDGRLAPVQQRLAKPAHRRAVRGDHEAMQARGGDRPRVLRVKAEDRVRGLGPAHRAGDQALLPRANAAETLCVVEQVGEFLRLPDRPPGEQHVGEERRGVHPGDLNRVHLADQGSAGQVVGGGPRHVLGAAAGQDTLGHREQAVAGSRRRIGLKQGQPGEVGRRTAGRVHEPGAHVHHAEVGHDTVSVPQRPDDQHGLGDLVKRPQDRQRRRRRPHRAVGQPQAEHVGEPGHGR